ncbi:MAG: IS21 family transposase [Agitococcus sp.]|nr:IS21 family transposase [Agitococcus sp.]
MRQIHKAGEKLFVDYSGMTVPILDQLSGETTTAQIFVGVLGGSNYSYVEATASQNLQDWVGSHVRMFAFFGALPRILVPDNLKSAVTKACQYDPVINPTAMHYNVAVVPARKYKPKDKAAVEKGVQVAQRWILARLRNHRFYSLHELNEAIKPLVTDLNHRQLKRIAASRHSQFVEIDLPAMRPLPSAPFELAEWRTGLRVGSDYHAVVDGYAYSVPYRLAKEKVEARLTQSVIEFFHNGGRVATHERKYQNSGHVTLTSHMQKTHLHYAAQSSEHLLQWALRVGQSTFAVFSHQLESRPHPEAGYRSCLGLQRLTRSYSEEHLEATCQRAIYINSRSYTSISSILKTNLDKQPLVMKTDVALPIEHNNVRGSDYYTGAGSC